MSDAPPAPDGLLLHQYLSGRPQAFEELVDRHEAALLRLASRSVRGPEAAQDAVQETFVRLLRTAPRLRSSPDLRGWLYRVCRNLCADAARKEARMNQHHQKVAVPEVAAAEPNQWEQEEEAGKVRDLLHELPPDEREVLLLKVQQGHSYREISALTGKSLHQVGSCVHRALRRMSTRLREAGLIA